MLNQNNKKDIEKRIKEIDKKCIEGNSKIDILKKEKEWLLKVLKDIYNSVYCTNCLHFRVCDEGLPYCINEDKCNINDYNKEKNISDRPFYILKEIV